MPISALCPAIGAILARVLFKQPLTPRMLLGIGICFLASFMIASTSLGGDASSGMRLGLSLLLARALGWGLEGCIAGYGTSMIDYQIGITIRQCTSGLSNLIILLPLMSLVGGEHAGYAWHLVSQAVSDGRSIIFFVISGFFAVYAYSLWYKGNSMCGAALGMACNGAFSFWGPFSAGSCSAWSAVSRLEYCADRLGGGGRHDRGHIYHRCQSARLSQEEKEMSRMLPLNYAILKYFTTVERALCRRCHRSACARVRAFQSAAQTGGR